MGIRNREGALYIATGVDTSGLYAGRRETIGIIKAMASQITSFDVFSGIGISAATAFASAAKSAYNFEKEFHKNMLEVATISTQVSGSMADFMNRVLSITQQIPVTAPEAAKALYQIVSAGHDGAAGMQILEVAAKSAVGGLTDTATAADAITTLLNAYKLSADQAATISDQLFTTVRLGKTDFGQLGQSIAQVAPIAASYGVEIDQVLAAVASLTKQGTPTAQAMTQIRAAIIGTSKVLGDGAFEGRTFQEALAEVAARANGSESKLRELVPEIEAVNGVLGMTGQNAKAAASDLGELQNSAGATEAAFEKMQEDVDNQMKLLSNNIHAALRPMGEAILKNVSEAAQMINKGFETGDVQNSLESLKKLLIGVAGVYVTYKSSVIGASAAEAFHSAKITVSNTLKSLQNKIIGESVLAKERERKSQEAYIKSLEQVLTSEQKAKISTLNLTKGSKEHLDALIKLKKEEQAVLDKQVASLGKETSAAEKSMIVARNRKKEASALVEIRKQELASLVGTTAAEKTETAQKQLSVALDNQRIAREKAIAANRLKIASQQAVIAAKENGESEKKIVLMQREIQVHNQKVIAAKAEYASATDLVRAKQLEINAIGKGVASKKIDIAQKRLQVAVEKENVVATQANAAMKNFYANKSAAAIASTKAGTVALQLNTAQQRASAAASNVLATVSNKAKLATSALWGVMKANPIGAVLTAISLATTAYMLFADKIKAAETAQSRLNKLNKAAADNMAAEKAELGLLLSVAKNELVSKEDRLKAIKKLNEISPEYLGNLSLENLGTKEATESIEAYTKAIEKNAKMQAAKDMISDKYKKQLEVQKEIEDLENKKRINKGNKVVGDTFGGNKYLYAGKGKDVDYDDKIKNKQKQYDALQSEIDQILSFTQDEVKKQPIEIPVNIQIASEQANISALLKKKEEIEARMQARKENGLFEDAFDATQLAAVNVELEKANANLEALNQTSSSTTKGETVLQRKLTLTKELAAAEAKLKKLRASDSTATDAEIAAAEKEVEEKKKALKALTGLSEKEGDKTKQAQQELSRSILDSELRLQADRIALMEEGKAKRLALAKQEYDEAIAGIDKKEEELLSKTGITEDQKKRFLEQNQSLRLVEQQKLLKANTDIEKASSKELQSIWEEVNARFSSGLDNRLAEIDKFYKEAIKKAKEGGASEIEIRNLVSKSDKERANALNENYIDSEMQRLEIAENVESRIQEVKSQTYVSDALGAKRQNDIHKKYCQARLNVLKKSTAAEGTERSKQIEAEKKNLQNELDFIEENTQIIISSIAQDAVAGVLDLADSLEDVNEELSMASGLARTLLDSVIQMASKNYVGGIVSLLGMATSVISSIAKSNQEAIAIAKKAEGDYWDAVNWKIERQIALMKELHEISSDQVEESMQWRSDALYEKLQGVDLDVKMNKGHGLEGFFNLVDEGIESARKRGDKFAENFLQGLYDKVKNGGADVDGHWNFRFYDIFKGMSKEDIIALQGIPEIWQLLPEEIQEYIKQLSDAEDAQKDFEQSTEDALFGQGVQSAIDDFAQAYADAWAAGEDRAKSMKDVAKNMIKQTIVEMIKSSGGLADTVVKLREMIKGFLTDDIIDEWEQKDIDDFIESEVNRIDGKYSWADKYLKGDKKEEDEPSGNTLKGAFAKASQESIDLLAGQTGAQRVAIESIRDQMKEIRDLQAQGWQDVKAIRDLTVKIDKNSEQMAANTRLIHEVADRISESTKRAAESLDSIDNHGIKVKM